MIVLFSGSRRQTFPFSCTKITSISFQLCDFFLDTLCKTTIWTTWFSPFKYQASAFVGTQSILLLWQRTTGFQMALMKHDNLLKCKVSLFLPHWNAGPCTRYKEHGLFLFAGGFRDLAAESLELCCG